MLILKMCVPVYFILGIPRSCLASCVLTLACFLLLFIIPAHMVVLVTWIWVNVPDSDAHSSSTSQCSETNVSYKVDGPSSKTALVLEVLRRTSEAFGQLAARSPYKAIYKH